MGLRQTTQQKPATIILTEVLRMVVPARRPEATEESTPLPRPIDPDAEAGRGRLGMAY
jgi:hypothetical protein